MDFSFFGYFTLIEQYLGKLVKFSHHHVVVWTGILHISAVDERMSGQQRFGGVDIVDPRIGPAVFFLLKQFY